MAWMVNLTHYLDSEGRIAPNMPVEAWRLARYFGSIAAAASATLDGGDARNFVRCRKRPGRKPCSGLIQDDFLEPIDSIGKPDLAFNVEGLGIGWRCPVCGDQGVITGWADSPWDRSPGSIMLTDSLSV